MTVTAPLIGPRIMPVRAREFVDKSAGKFVCDFIERLPTSSTGEPFELYDWERDAIMRNIGVYSVNDIRKKEGEPDVPGGDTRYANLNNIPLERFDELSVARNLKGGNPNNAD